MTGRRLRRGLGLRDGPGSAPGFPAVPRLGRGGVHPVPAGQDKPSRPVPARQAKKRLTGQTRPAPLRVADGDGMDRHHGAHAPGAPGIRVNSEEKENGRNRE